MWWCVRRRNSRAGDGGDGDVGGSRSRGRRRRRNRSGHANTTGCSRRREPGAGRRTKDGAGESGERPRGISKGADCGQGRAGQATGRGVPRRIAEALRTSGSGVGGRRGERQGAQAHAPRAARDERRGHARTGTDKSLQETLSQVVMKLEAGSRGRCGSPVTMSTSRDKEARRGCVRACVRVCVVGGGRPIHDRDNGSSGRNGGTTALSVGQAEGADRARG